MYLQNCGLRKFSYEILTKEVFFFFFQHFFLSQSSELFAAGAGSLNKVLRISAGIKLIFIVLYPLNCILKDLLRICSMELS